MYFYIDESGHTGPNLFDPAQPTLYYGVLSAAGDVDALAARRVAKLRKKLGVERLHAAELGNGRLASIANDIRAIQKVLRLRFDLYRVVKPDHAIICFFDQVFDSGMNPAITWTGYWTPLRFVLLLKLATLFDEGLAKLAWAARIEINDAVAQQKLVEVCTGLLVRVSTLPDARSKELISDTLQWAIDHPADIGYNVNDEEMRLQVMPNVVGFQSVMHGIARCVKTYGTLASKIVVDQQTQFNKAQKSLAVFYASARDVPWTSGPGLPVMDLTHIPDTPITVMSSHDSAGLELVDIYIWIFKRWLEKKELAPELRLVVFDQFSIGETDELSLKALAKRWTQWFEELPEPTAEQFECGKELMEMAERRRKDALANSAGGAEE
ncbi:MAG: DUF3800 domain-containing protein [Rhodocyclaceae bacterium]|nr:DUF3800 domain-containing protein [Rhodocyclaceae bacterium]